MQWNPKYTLVLLGVTFITYQSAICMARLTDKGRKKCLFVTGVLLGLLPLLIFKYTGFLYESFQSIVGAASSVEINLIAPLGISFFTFQAVGYLFDVYYKRSEVEYNWWNYMLFVCFFPQLLSGPISKAADLMPQINRSRLFHPEQAVQGMKWLLWGMFLKTVFADRIGIFVDSVYQNYEHLNGMSCLLGAVAYSFQIYGDFAGYSFMALGVGELMGFELINNFQRPYFAASITEFWRRWHISLTRWLTYNVYIPLGGSRCSQRRQYGNIMITFLVSGLWHGANWTFVVWGGLHGLFQIIEKALGIDPKGKYANARWMTSFKSLRILVTFSLVTFAWIFFRMPTVTDAFYFIGKIFTDSSSASASYTPSLLLFILMGVFIVFVKDSMDEYLAKPCTILHHRYIGVRWVGYITLLYLILICGVFDAGSFIYVSF